MQIDDKYDNDDGDSKAKNVRKTVKGLETGGNTLHKLNDGNVFSNGSSGRGGAHVHIVDAKQVGKGEGASSWMVDGQTSYIGVTEDDVNNPHKTCNHEVRPGELTLKASHVTVKTDN